MQEEPAELKLAPLPYSGKGGAEPAKCKWDPNSYANCDQLLTTHFHLSLYVDFDQNSLIGSNTINMTAQADGVTQLVLDYQGININQVEQVDSTSGSWISTQYIQSNGRFGNALIITLLKSLNN